MTPQEFQSEYNKLIEVYPEFFKSPHKAKAIAAYVRNIDHKWWAALVNRMILSSNPRLDIEEAARGERLARQKLRAARETLAAMDTFSKNSTQAGLDNYLKSQGANSLLEIIEKNKKGETT